MMHPMNAHGLGCDRIGRDSVLLEVGPVTVSTLGARGEYETALLWRDEYCDVQSYPSRAAAVAGHRGWTDPCNVAMVMAEGNHP